jgi:hypothetical protein
VLDDQGELGGLIRGRNAGGHESGINEGVALLAVSVRTAARPAHIMCHPRRV